MLQNNVNSLLDKKKNRYYNWDQCLQLICNTKNKKCKIINKDDQFIEFEVQNNIFDSELVCLNKSELQYEESDLQESNDLIKNYLLRKKYIDQNETFLIKKIDDEFIAINIYSIIDLIIEKQKIKKYEITERCNKILSLMLRLIRKTFMKSYKTFLNKKGLIILKNIEFKNSFLKMVDKLLLEIINFTIKVSEINFLQKPFGALKKSMSFAMAPITKNNKTVS